jgi:hypothetical protein
VSERLLDLDGEYLNPMLNKIHKVMTKAKAKVSAKVKGGNQSVSEVSLDQDTAIATAKEAGCEIIRGNACLLLLDLDGEHALKLFEKRVIGDCSSIDSHFDGHIQQFNPNKIRSIHWRGWKSSSGMGMHVTCRLSKPLAIPVLLILQSYLGSDTKRDFLCLMRLWEGNKEPRLLFKPAGEEVHEGITKVVGAARHLAANLASVRGFERERKRLVEAREADESIFDNQDDIPF